MTAYAVVNSKTCSCERAKIKPPYIQISAKSIVGQKTAKPLHILSGNGSVSIKIPSLLQNIHLTTSTVTCGTDIQFLLKINSLEQNCYHVSDNFVIRTRSFCMNRFLSHLIRGREALCILMQYKIELMYTFGIIAF